MHNLHESQNSDAEWTEASFKRLGSAWLHLYGILGRDRANMTGARAVAASGQGGRGHDDQTQQGGKWGAGGRGGSVSESVSNNINLCIILRTIPQKVNFLVFSFKNIKLRKKRADNSHFLLKAIQIIQSKSVPLLWQTGSSSTAFGVSAARGSSSKHLASWLRMCTITLEGGLGLGLIYRKNWG